MMGRAEREHTPLALAEWLLELARRTQMENHFAGVSKMVGLGKAAP